MLLKKKANFFLQALYSSRISERKRSRQHRQPENSGGDKRDRTVDLLHAMQALSQLSYTPKEKTHYRVFSEKRKFQNILFSHPIPSVIFPLSLLRPFSVFCFSDRIFLHLSASARRALFPTDSGP